MSRVNYLNPTVRLIRLMTFGAAVVAMLVLAVFQIG